MKKGDRVYVTFGDRLGEPVIIMELWKISEEYETSPFLLRYRVLFMDGTVEWVRKDALSTTRIPMR